MICIQRLLLAVLILGNLTSCIISRKFSSIQFEVQNPSEIALPDHIKTVAVVNRDLSCTDTSLVLYNYMNNGHKVDTIKNLKLTNECIYSLIKVLQKDGKFEQIVNCSDSAIHSRKLMHNWTRNDILDSVGTDLCIFIDSLRFSGIHVSGYPNLYQTKVSLNWSYTYRSDSAYHTSLQNDSIEYYDYFRLIANKGKKMYLMSYLNLSCMDIGKLLGSKFIQTWTPVQQVFYHSPNNDMLQAEKFARKNEWIKAAEIWNQKTKSKNRKLAAKACYNMAVSCEMMGYPDLAIEWLKKNDFGSGLFMQEYNDCCKQYIKVLTLRKKEIEQLNRQIREQE